MLLTLDVDPCLQRLSDSKCCSCKMLYGSCVCIQLIIHCALGLSSVIDAQTIQLLTENYACCIFGGMRFMRLYAFVTNPYQQLKGEFHPIWNLHRVLPTHRIL